MGCWAHPFTLLLNWDVEQGGASCQTLFVWAHSFSLPHSSEEGWGGALQAPLIACSQHHHDIVCTSFGSFASVELVKCVSLTIPMHIIELTSSSKGKNWIFSFRLKVFWVPGHTQQAGYRSVVLLDYINEKVLPALVSGKNFSLSLLRTCGSLKRHPPFHVNIYCIPKLCCPVSLIEDSGFFLSLLGPYSIWMYLGDAQESMVRCV